MPNIITLGVINVSTPQDNAGVFIGQMNITGWDSHSKFNMGHGAQFGVLDWNGNNINFTFDGYEVMDGVIIDQDIKWQIASNF